MEAGREQVIAIRGPDVGSCGLRGPLEARGNTVHVLEGGVLSREMFPDLYQAIGVTFGGDDERGTFCLPDLRHTSRGQS